MELFLKNLSTVASSPYAFVAYVLLIGVWALVVIRTNRIRSLAKTVSLIPESDRKSLLEKDYGYHLKEGMSARDFLRAQLHSYIFYGLMAVLAVIGLLAVLTVLKPEPSVVDVRTEKLTHTVNELAHAIDNDFKDIKGARSTEEGDTGSNTFESNVKLPDSTYNYIELDPPDDPAYLASLYFGSDKRTAYLIYQKFVSNLRIILSDWIESPGALNQRQDFIDYATFVRGKRKVIVSLGNRKEPTEFHVMVMFKKVDPPDSSNK